MSWTDAELKRIEALESILSDTLTSINNIFGKLQSRQLQLIKQSEINNLISKVTTLEAKIEALKDRYL